MATQPPAYRSVGELRASGYRPRSIRDELRSHVLERLREGRHLSDELTIHFGLVPRTHRGIFCINELPDLAEKVQVSLFNVMEERDVQVKGYRMRLPIDVLIVATANPEDYTSRGRIITPLKDRYKAQIRTRYPRDQFFVVGFSTRAREIKIQELPEVSWDMAEPFTNLQEGLMLAERLIARNPSRSPQILVITDGQPTAYFLGRELHVEWPMGFGGVSPHAVAETMKQVRRLTRRGVTINTFMLDDSPELLGFVEHMTEVNRGRAFFTAPSRLGSFMMVDYLNGRRNRRF
ncbi:MAG: sigma 54-interacting transcriptional regulator [Myxococcales bacterium]|nr:sigma 54-interacting transcriptional regulator [Myxococcales bacterium]